MDLQGSEKFSIEDEQNAIHQEFGELLALDKPGLPTFYLYNSQGRLCSFSLSGSEETYLSELGTAIIFLSSINHPRFIFAYDTTIAYMGNIEQSSVVSFYWVHHREPQIAVTPYKIENSTFISLSDELEHNKAVSLISADVLVNLAIVELFHSKSIHDTLEDIIEYMTSIDIDFSFAHGVNKSNLGEILRLDYYETGIMFDESIFADPSTTR